MKTTTVIIPTLLTDYDLLDNCLQSLSKQTYKKFSVTVVVNKLESDRSKAFFKNYPNIEVLYLGTNLGFTGAVNEGIKASDSEYIVLLNDDTKVEKQWLSELITTQKKSGADMVASNIYLSDKKTIDSQGFGLAWRGKAEAIVNGNCSLSEHSDYWLHDQNKKFLKQKDSNNEYWNEPFGPDAAACLYTKKLFDLVGLFNNNFFAYLEDVELALRARKTGLYCAFSKNAIVYHHKHATSVKKSGFKQMQDFKNWWRIVLGEYPATVWKKFSVIILIERLRNLKGIISQN